jgi:DNA-binding IclR family transcriptional regulator
MSPRSGTKIAEVIELLQREDGATLTELAVTTGWLTHTTRAALTGLRKRGYAIAADRTDKLRGSVYWIELMEMSSDSYAAGSGARTPTDEAQPERPERAAGQRSRQPDPVDA